MNFRIDLYASKKDLSLFKDTETRFNISVLESMSITSTCKNTASISKKDSFPSVDAELLKNFKKDSYEKENWNVLLNNTLFNGVHECDKKSETNQNSKCIIDVYGDLNFNKNSKSIAIMLSVPLSQVFKE